MKFWPLAAARRSTSVVAMTVVAMPVTTVPGSPALNPSADCARHSTPIADRSRSTICCAVSAPRCLGNGRTARRAAVAETRNSRLELWESSMAGGLYTQPEPLLPGSPHELDYSHRQSTASHG